MKSGVRSSVHLSTANAPSTAVQCHKPSTAGRRKPVDGNTLSTTNDYLKKGGSLPPVLSYSGIQKESPPNKTAHNGRHQQAVQTINPKVKKGQSSDKVEDIKIELRSDLNHHCEDHINVNDLERKMEQLSSKLSTVQDILSDHMKNEDSNLRSYNDDKSQGFSAQDYALLMSEMKRNLAAYPYDPNEFSDKNARSVDEVSDKLAENQHVRQDKKEILQAIQRELSMWRNEDSDTYSMYCVNE